MSSLELLINEASQELSKAKIYNNKFAEDRAKVLLAHLLELKEHRKAFGLDKLLEG